jgi:hypothetical protein
MRPHRDQTAAGYHRDRETTGDTATDQSRCHRARGDRVTETAPGKTAGAPVRVPENALDAPAGAHLRNAPDDGGRAPEPVPGVHAGTVTGDASPRAVRGDVASRRRPQNPLDDTAPAAVELLAAPGLLAADGASASSGACGTALPLSCGIGSSSGRAAPAPEPPDPRISDSPAGPLAASTRARWRRVVWMAGAVAAWSPAAGAGVVWYSATARFQATRAAYLSGTASGPTRPQAAPAAPAGDRTTPDDAASAPIEPTAWRSPAGPGGSGGRPRGSGRAAGATATNGRADLGVRQMAGPRRRSATGAEFACGGGCRAQARGALPRARRAVSTVSPCVSPCADAPVTRGTASDLAILWCVSPWVRMRQTPRLGACRPVGTPAPGADAAGATSGRVRGRRASGGPETSCTRRASGGPVDHPRTVETSRANATPSTS